MILILWLNADYRNCCACFHWTSTLVQLTDWLATPLDTWQMLPRFRHWRDWLAAVDWIDRTSKVPQNSQLLSWMSFWHWTVRDGYIIRGVARSKNVGWTGHSWRARGAPAYNVVWGGAPAGSRGRAPGQGVREAKLPWSWKPFSFWCPTEAANLLNSPNHDRPPNNPPE